MTWISSPNAGTAPANLVARILSNYCLCVISLDCPEAYSLLMRTLALFTVTEHLFSSSFSRPNACISGDYDQKGGDLDRSSTGGSIDRTRPSHWSKLSLRRVGEPLLGTVPSTSPTSLTQPLWISERVGRFYIIRNIPKSPRDRMPCIAVVTSITVSWPICVWWVTTLSADSVVWKQCRVPLSALALGTSEFRWDLTPP